MWNAWAGAGAATAAVVLLTGCAGKPALTSEGPGPFSASPARVGNDVTIAVAFFTTHVPGVTVTGARLKGDAGPYTVLQPYVLVGRKYEGFLAAGDESSYPSRSLAGRPLHPVPYTVKDRNTSVEIVIGARFLRPGKFVFDGVAVDYNAVRTFHTIVYSDSLGYCAYRVRFHGTCTAGVPASVLGP
jgi:hypothetical protein